MRAKHSVVGVLSVSLCLVTTSVQAEDTSKSLGRWVREFEARYCARSCAILEKEAQQAQQAVDQLPADARPTEGNRAVQVRVFGARRDLEACQLRQAAEQEEAMRQLEPQDCSHVVALVDHSAVCADQWKGRDASCRAQAAEEARKAEEVRKAKERAAAEAYAKLLQDKKLLLITYSAALCVYQDTKVALPRPLKAGALVAPLIAEEPSPEETDEKAHLAELESATRARLKRDLHEPPLPCTDLIVRHVADCLWLSEFESLPHHPGVLPPEKCRDPRVQRSNALGTLLQASVAAK